MLSLIFSYKNTFKHVIITAAWSSNLGMLGLLFACAKHDFNKIKLHLTVLFFISKKALAPNAESEASANICNSMQEVSTNEKMYSVVNVIYFTQID